MGVGNSGCSWSGKESHWQSLPRPRQQPADENVDRTLVSAETDQCPGPEEEDSHAAEVDEEFAREMDPGWQVAAVEKQRYYPCSVGIVLRG